MRLSNDWGEDFEEDEEVEGEAVELRGEGGGRVSLGRLSALYPYSGEEEGTLPLQPGQQFRYMGVYIPKCNFIDLCLIQGTNS